MGQGLSMPSRRWLYRFFVLALLGPLFAAVAIPGAFAGCEVTQPPGSLRLWTGDTETIPIHLDGESNVLLVITNTCSPDPGGAVGFEQQTFPAPAPGKAAEHDLGTFPSGDHRLTLTAVGELSVWVHVVITDVPEEPKTTTTVAPSNPKCADLGWTGASVKDDAPGDTFVDGPVTITYDGLNSATVIVEDGYTAAFVIVKAGSGAVIYDGSPWVGLVAPLNPNSPDPDDTYDISHVEVCYQVAEPEEPTTTTTVAPTATTVAPTATTVAPTTTTEEPPAAETTTTAENVVISASSGGEGSAVDAEGVCVETEDGRYVVDGGPNAGSECLPYTGPHALMRPLGIIGGLLLLAGSVMVLVGRLD